MASPMVIGALSGIGIGAGKHFLFDQPEARRRERQRLITLKYSGITGRNPGPSAQQPNLFNTVLQFGSTGAQLGQGIGAAQAAGGAGASSGSMFDKGSTGLESTGSQIQGSGSQYINSPSVAQAQGSMLSASQPEVSPGLTFNQGRIPSQPEFIDASEILRRQPSPSFFNNRYGFNREVNQPVGFSGGYAPRKATFIYGG